MVSNKKILKNFDEITYKTPHRPFLENFEKFRKFDPPTPKKSLVIAFLRKKFRPSVLFYGSKKPILCCWDSAPKGRSPQEYRWSYHNMFI